MAYQSNSTLSPEEKRGRYDLLSELEGALAILSGLVKAIDEISNTKSNPARRLSAICAICSPVYDEVERAEQACRDLHELHFAEKSQPLCNSNAELKAQGETELAALS